MYLMPYARQNYIATGEYIDAYLIDFSLLSISKGEYIATGYITEKVDVYIYGVLLLRLLA